ncbi:DNA sulfur modification protein DndD [Allocatelliglobosispora scoriae]|uniref:Nuclease SbcCD subunit C n=1 Tax=Allocatelliglobosispora scoriae TaxID=643052 RepID=A0A841BYM2_9ACTN|nr:DNA sulfur modification protein DndD [Allocatelliglobosispora scoriae]MBB5871902.1 DNA sulfur modification protein DndD [Allocatelliglobosispora scoriae]
MIFQELVLTNIGPFAGRQSMRLAPKEPHRPIILFGGLNGAGKTTILEALLLVLYGPHTPGSSRRATSYERYLTQLIHYAADPAHGASIELLFRAVNDGAWQEFRLVRRWAVVGGRLREVVEVSRDGYADQVLTEGWADHVETLAPRGVANLFFFDGEQIEAFAEPDVSQELVRTAISGLLGLDLVDRLQEDLTVLERRHRQEAAQGGDLTGIEEKQQMLEQCQEAEVTLLQDLEDAHRELKLAIEGADAARSRLNREGAQQYQQRDQLASRLHAAKTDAKAARDALIESIGGYGPLLLVPDLLAAVTEQATSERRHADDQALATLLADRDQQLLDLMQTQRAAAKVVDALTAFLTEDRARRTAAAPTSPFLHPDEPTLLLAQSLQGGELTETLTVLRERVAELDQARVNLDHADRAAAAVPQKDLGDAMMIEFEAANNMLARARARVEILSATHAEAQASHTLAKKAYTQALAVISEERLRSERVRRLVDHAARARDTLAILRAKATQRHVQRIQSMVFDSLRLLLRKEHLIREVSIDPETCSMELLNNDGRPVRPRSLSAGERQLLAVALLAGLARASGRMLPVVIDTPLGRLDQDHRMRFVQSYLPNASHQVIVLSTDTEITPDVLDTLREADVVSHTIRLEHDAKTGTTRGVEGYFDAPAARGKRPAKGSQL